MFKEATRHTAHNGDIHIHSVAYEALQAFITAHDEIHRLREKAKKAQMSLAEASANYHYLAAELFDALEAHYQDNTEDGPMPEAMNFGNTTLIFRPGENPPIEVIPTASYAQLYRIESPQEA